MVANGLVPTPRLIWVVANERAVADPVLSEAIAALTARGHRIEVRQIDGAGNAAQLAAEGAAAGFESLVAAGGDGTLNEVVNGVAHSGKWDQCAVGVLPFGTANDFATACRIPLNEPLVALSLIAEGPIRPIDVGRVNQTLFINVASAGAVAEITTETNPEVKKLLGGFAYFLTGLASVTNLCAKSVTVRAPGFEWTGAALAITVANGRQAGGGFRVAPNAVLDDGLLDGMIIPEVPLDQFLALIRDFSRLDQDADLDHLQRFRAPWIEIEAPEGLQVNVDGEPLSGTRFRFETAEARLRFHLPPIAPLSDVAAATRVPSV